MRTILRHVRRDGPFLFKFIIKQAEFNFRSAHIHTNRPLLHIKTHPAFPEGFPSLSGTIPEPHYSPSVSDDN